MKAKKTAWFVGALTSATTAVFIAAAIMDRNPRVTIADVGALLIADLLAGLFPGLGLTSSRQSSTPEKSVERTAGPLLRSTLGGNSGVPFTLHRPSRRRSLTSFV